MNFPVGLSSIPAEARVDHVRDEKILPSKMAAMVREIATHVFQQLQSHASMNHQKPDYVHVLYEAYSKFHSIISRIISGICIR